MEYQRPGMSQPAIVTYEVPVDATAACTDGDVGWITDVVVDPIQRSVTHVVVRENHAAAREFLVPFQAVSACSRKVVTLGCARADLAAFPDFTTTRYVPASSPEAQPVVAEWEMQSWNYYQAYEPIYSPVISPDTPVPVDEHHVPAGEVAFERGTPVLSTDAELVGGVLAFLVQSDTGAISHIVVRLDLSGSAREVTLPVSAISGATIGAIQLGLRRQQLDQLPGVPVDGRFSAAPAGPEALFLLSIVFDQPDKAEQALRMLRDKFRKVDAAIVRKNTDGKITSRETHDISTRGAAVTGAVVGGVVSVLGGPVGLVAASAIGGAAGAAVGRRDRGVPDGYVRDLGRALDAGSSAVVALVPRRAEGAVLETLAPLNGALLRLALDDEMLARLTANG